MKEWGIPSAINLEERSMWLSCEGWACHLESHEILQNIIYDKERQGVDEKYLVCHDAARRSFATFPPLKTIKMRSAPLGAFMLVLSVDGGVTIAHVIEALMSWFVYFQPTVF